jgi:hypothetical protein
MRRFALIVSFAAAAIGCKDDHDPVHVPFDGVDPKAPKKTSTPLPPPATSSGSATGSGAPIPSGTAPRAARDSAFEVCCGALRYRAANAPGSDLRKAYAAAIHMCDTQRAQVDAGKVTVPQAVAAVRSALSSGDVPTPCR